MQQKHAKKERFIRLPDWILLRLFPLLRVLEMQVFLACWQVGQDRWERTPLVLGSLAASVGRDRAQVRRSLRMLAALGIFELQAGPRPGTYLVTPPSDTDLPRLLGELKGSGRGGKRPPLRLVPPLPQPPPPPPKGKGRKGNGGGEGEGPPLDPLGTVTPLVAGEAPAPSPRTMVLVRGGGGDSGDGPEPTLDTAFRPLAPLGGGDSPGLPSTLPPPPPATPTEPQETLPDEPPAGPPAPARPPSAPTEEPEPFFPSLLSCGGGTPAPAEGGTPAPPISSSGEISKNPSVLPDASDDSGRTSEGEILNFPRKLTLEEISPDDPDDPRFAHEDAAGPRTTLEQVQVLCQVVELCYLPELPRRVSAPLLARLLGWCDTFLEAQAYLRERLPAAQRDPSVRAPLAWVCHEPAFVAWRREQAAAAAAAAARAQAREREKAREAQEGPWRGPVPLGEVLGRSEALGRARGVLAALGGPPAGLTLPGEHFGPDATGVQVYKGFRYLRAGEVWRRAGKA